MESQPAGFHFEPSAEELISFLGIKAKGEPLNSGGFLMECDIYGEKEPWLIFNKFSKQDNYVFTELKKKSPSKIQRTAGSGTWVSQRTNKVYGSNGQLVGFKKLLIFEDGKKGSGSTDKDGTNGHWIMHEFSLVDQHQLCVVCKIRNKKPVSYETFSALIKISNSSLSQNSLPLSQMTQTEIYQPQGPHSCGITPAKQPPAARQPPLVRVTNFKDLGLDNILQRQEEETQPQQQPKRPRISGIAPAEQPQQMANYMNLRMPVVCHPPQPQPAADYTDLWLSSTSLQPQEETAPPLQRPWSFAVAPAEEPQPVADNMYQEEKTEPQLMSMLPTSHIAPPEQPQAAADNMDFELHSTWQPHDDQTAPQPIADYTDMLVGNLRQTRVGEAQPQPNMLRTSHIIIAPPEQPQPASDHMDLELHRTCQPQEEETTPQPQSVWTCGVAPEEELEPVGDYMDFWLRNL